jgi:hypothetical protein
VKKCSAISWINLDRHLAIVIDAKYQSISIFNKNEKQKIPHCRSSTVQVCIEEYVDRCYLGIYISKLREAVMAVIVW